MENPLRILDSKSIEIQDILEDAPSIEDFLDESSRSHLDKLLNILDQAKIDYSLNPRLVRGLDYYNHTVFEWKTDLLGSQDTILGGGRYDHLVEELGGKPCPAVGFSLGLERLVLLLTETNKLNIRENLDIYFICLSEEAAKKAIIVAEELRDSNPSLTIKSNLGLESPSSQFKKADKSGAKIALIIGEEELLNDEISFKDLRIKSEQKKLSLEEVKSEISNSITNNHV